MELMILISTSLMMYLRLQICHILIQMSLFLCPKIILIEYLFFQNGISVLLLLQRRGKMTIKLPKIHYCSYQITNKFIKLGIMAEEEVWQYISVKVFIFKYQKKQSINSNHIESACIAIIRKNAKNIIDLPEVTHMNFQTK